MENFIVLVVAYFIGSIPFAFIIGKVNGVDIRKLGSGNVGATNVLRNLGKKWGIPCFICDFLKGMVPVLIATSVCSGNDLAPIMSVIGTVLGHVFTIFLRFKGGKGVATTAGALMGIAWYPVLIGLIIWFITLKLTGYVSLGSIIAAAVIPIIICIDKQFNSATNYLFIVMGILVIYRHKSNIHRLIKGEESKFKKKGK